MKNSRGIYSFNKNGKQKELVKAVELSDNAPCDNQKDESTDIRQILSPKFYNNEQALRSVVIMAYLSSVDDYIHFEELASGKGYIDLLFLPADHQRALIIELWWNKSYSRNRISSIQSSFDTKGKILLVGIIIRNQKTYLQN